MALFLTSLVAPAAASVLFGGAWAPPGIGEIAWSDADALTGTLAGEFDGLLRPPLTAHGGWVGRHDAVLAGLALTRFDTTRFGDGTARSLVGSTRISLDYRRYLWAREADRVDLYGDVGLYGIAPNSITQDSSFTASEDKDAAEADEGVKAMIGGVGGQVGIGGEYVFGDKQSRPSVSVGVRTLMRLHRGQVEQEDATTVSTVVLTETAFVLEFTR
jgi:hypothetical protein